MAIEMYEVRPRNFKKDEETTTVLKPGDARRFQIIGRVRVDSDDQVTVIQGPVSRTFTGDQINSVCLVDPFHLFPRRLTIFSWKPDEQTSTP